VKVFVHRDRVVDLLVGSQLLSTTEDHPFWSVTEQRLVRADPLTAGSRVVTADGRRVKVGGLVAGSSREAWA
jgi:hypothetical protein